MFLGNNRERSNGKKYLKVVGFSVLMHGLSLICYPQVAVQQPVEAQQLEKNDLLFPEKHPNLYQAIAQENLKSMTDVDLTGTENGLRSSFKKLDDEGWAALVKGRFESQLNLKSDVRRRLIFTLLSKYEEANSMPQSSVIDYKTWQDLELLCGPKSNAKVHLAAQLDRTVTEVGRATFYRKIVQPMIDRQHLENQQAIIKELITNQEFFNELDIQLKELVVPENLLLSLWDDEDFFSFILEREKIKLPLDSKVELIKQVEKWLNTSPLTLQARGMYRRILWRMSDVFALYGAIALPYYAATGKSIIPFLPAEDFNKIAPYSLLGVLCWIINKALSDKIAARETSLIAAYDYAHQAYYSWREFWEGNVFGKYFHEKLVNLAKYINNLKTMAQAINKNETLVHKFPAVKRFNEALKKISEKSDDMKLLLDILATDTFKGEFTNWFSYGGRKIVAYLLLMELKDNFVEAMMAVGELDAQLSIAKLYKEFKDKHITFCFPKYINNIAHDKPSLDIQDFWNPFIDPLSVVPSSLALGDLSGNPADVIITGPNAGGKSTITKALIISIILAQTLGIAPAQSLTFTPFTSIITYLNITDDIAAGNSHFKAGVLRARDVIDTMNKLKPGEFGLTAIDEVFNGTTFKEGQAAAYSLLKILGANNRCMCVTCTHFPLIPELEKETGRFVNYKVSVVEQDGNKIQYPFKLERGISHQIITLKILKEEGFGDAFLQEAEHALSAA